MKARIKSTGDIMPIASYAKVTLDVCDDRGTPYEVDFEDVELISDDETKCDADWSSFRREAAKDFMTAIIAREAPQYDFACRNVSIRVSEAIMWADELIKQLREEKK